MGYNKIGKILEKAERNIPLKNYSTFKIGGKAEYFYKTKNKNDLVQAVLESKKNNLNFFVLGNGSNLLISDGGFRGVVIKNQSSNFVLQQKKEKLKIICDAGLPLAKIVAETTNRGFSGLEWAIGIPGTFGGAIYGNAGAFGDSIADIIKIVEVFDVKNNKILHFKNKNCKFSYRGSIFKKNKNLIILSADIILKKDKKSKIKERIKKNLNYRNLHQPLNFPSIGSIFKNPKKLSAGKLIEECGLRGKMMGKAQISKKHANFIVNLGNATSKDILKLIKLAKKSVKKKFRVILEEEIQFLPPKI